MNDNESPYWAGFTTPYISFDEPLIEKKYMEGVIVTQPEGDYFIDIDTFIDDYTLPSKQLSLSGGGTPLGSFVLGESRLSGNNLIDNRWEIGSTGVRIKNEIYNNNINEDFYISQILYRFKPLGVRPKWVT